MEQLVSSTLSSLVGALCAWNGYCSFQACWGCPPWYETGGQPRPARHVDYFGRPIWCPAGLVVADQVRAVSQTTLEIAFTLFGKRFIEQRGVVYWPWLCCSFRRKEMVF